MLIYTSIIITGATLVGRENPKHPRSLQKEEAMCLPKSGCGYPPPAPITADALDQFSRQFLPAGFDPNGVNPNRSCIW